MASFHYLPTCLCDGSRLLGFYFKISNPDRANETFLIDYSHVYHPFGVYDSHDLQSPPQTREYTREITTDENGFGRSEIVRDYNSDWYMEYTMTASVRNEQDFGVITTDFEDAQLTDSWITRDYLEPVDSSLDTVSHLAIFLRNLRI